MKKGAKLRMTLVILAALFVVFSIGNAITVTIAKQRIMEVADMTATRDMDKILLETDLLLTRCQTSAWNFRGLLGYKSVTSDTLLNVMDNFLKVNPHLYGVSIAFNPELKDTYHFPLMGTYAYGNEKTGFHHVRIDTIYDYSQAYWFKHTEEYGHSTWGIPMKASDGTRIVPFCVPLHAQDGGDIIGVMAVVVSLEDLSKELQEAAPYKDAMVTMMDESFNFIVHPDPEYVMNVSLDSVLRSSQVHPNESIYIDMRNKVRGSDLYGSGKDEHIIYYAPVEKTGWTVTIDSPSSNIYSRVDEVKKAMLINMVIGMLIFALVCWRLIKRIEEFEKTTAQKAAMQGELNIAAAIQKGMLPKLYPAFPDVKELDVYGMLIPAKEVGGDLFDYFVRDDKFFFCIGDVSGKGVPASLFMAVLRSLFRNVTLHQEKPSLIANALNTALAEGNDQNMFCTMFLGVLDLKTGHLNFCNCGHNAPIVRHIKADGELNVCYEKIETNIAVGIFEGFPYVDQEADMKPGEAVFLYTDGVTEAESANKELYGEERLLSALSQARANHVHTAKEFVDAVYEDVEKFAEIGYQSDDITMVYLEYKGKNA